MDLLKQLNNAVKYIEDNICDDIEIEKVSGATEYSPYHFGRIFYYITDMPISEYIRKRKLSLAAMELQHSKIKVLDLAVKYGYDSADSFTRAFIKQHGITPTEARRSGVIMKIFPPVTFQIKIQGVQEMNWRIEEREAFEVFGIEKIFKNNETNQVPDFWTECHQNGSFERLFDAAGGMRSADGRGYPRKDGSCVINAVCGYCEPGDDTFPYMICALTKPDSNTTEFKTAKIPKTTWAVFRSDKTDNIGLEIPSLFNRAYSEWLPSSGYDKSIGPDMEIYYTAFDSKHFEEVWIPVVKRND